MEAESADERAGRWQVRSGMLNLPNSGLGFGVLTIWAGSGDCLRWLRDDRPTRPRPSAERSSLPFTTAGVTRCGVPPVAPPTWPVHERVSAAVVCAPVTSAPRPALRLGLGSTGGEGLAGGQTQAREQPSSYHAPSSWFPVSRSRTVLPTRQSHCRIGTRPARNGSWRAGLAAACPPNGYSRAGRRLAR